MVGQPRVVVDLGVVVGRGPSGPAAGLKDGYSDIAGTEVVIQSALGRGVSQVHIRGLV